jgi:hypothetical protein
LGIVLSGVLKPCLICTFEAAYGTSRVKSSDLTFGFAAPFMVQFNVMVHQVAMASN